MTLANRLWGQIKEAINPIAGEGVGARCFEGDVLVPPISKEAWGGVQLPHVFSIYILFYEVSEIILFNIIVFNFSFLLDPFQGPMNLTGNGAGPSGSTQQILA